MSNDIPILVKKFLSHDPAWCCIHVGFGLAFLFQSELAVSLSRGDDLDEARQHFLDMTTRAHACLIARNRDGLVKLMLEAYSGDMRNQALDMMPQDDFKAFVDNMRKEVEALKKENGD